MKKAILAIIAVLYLVVTSGIQLQFHYCMGSLQRTSITVLQNTTCHTCGMAAKESGCCHTKSQWLKVNDNHQPGFTALSLPLPFEAVVFSVLHFSSKPLLSVKASLPATSHSPPILASNELLYIYHCVFRV